MLQQRQAKGRRLPRSGLRETEHVAAAKNKGNGLRLYGRGQGIIFGGKRAQKRLGQAESRKIRMSHFCPYCTRTAKRVFEGCCRLPRTSGANGMLEISPRRDWLSKLKPLRDREGVERISVGKRPSQ